MAISQGRVADQRDVKQFSCGHLVVICLQPPRYTNLSNRKVINLERDEGICSTRACGRNGAEILLDREWSNLTKSFRPDPSGLYPSNCIVVTMLLGQMRSTSLGSGSMTAAATSSGVKRRKKCPSNVRTIRTCSM